VHAVSLTPHAQLNFRITSKSENHIENGDAMPKKFKMHAVSMTPLAKYDPACTINEQFEKPWQLLKGISIKNKCFRIVLPQLYKNIKI
jgi:hypothetical protein